MLKSFPAQMATTIRSRRGRRNLRTLGIFFLVIAGLITVYSVGFHLLMLREGQEHTWITGFYWTLTVMSTLGFGDITFHTDTGRIFSMMVLLTGMIFLLVLLPFTFIEFFYEPWMRAQAEGRAPRQLPVGTRGHVVLTHYDAVTSAVIRRLEQFHFRYTLVQPKIEEALRLHDMGLNVMVGNLDDPETWKRARIESAALLATTASDIVNTNVAFTVRELAQDLHIVTSADREASVDILTLAGSDLVLRLEEMLGQSFARRTLGGDAKSHVIGQFGELLIAEANARHTPLVGKRLSESGLRKDLGVTVVGVLKHGSFEPAKAETEIHDQTVLMLAGSRQQLDRYDEKFSAYSTASAPVVILGGGGVGRATAEALAGRQVDYRVVELLPELIHDPEKYILGDAADLAVLHRAGIRETSTVIVTTNDDDLNIYLTIYCRQLRPDIQILSRATHERNLETLHRAGADSVLSYALMAASAVMNLLQGSKILMVAEGLDLFEVKVPKELAGQMISDSSIRERTGCSVVAIRTEEGIRVIPDPSTVLPADGEIVLVGSAKAERRFLKLFRNDVADDD